MCEYLDPQINQSRAIDLAFFFTVLEMFEYKFAVDPSTISQLFREDFKLYLINCKLRHIGGCPQISESTSSADTRLFCSLFLLLSSSIFSDLDDLIDSELHSLIKCVPKIIANNHLAEIRPADIDSFLREETS